MASLGTDKVRLGFAQGGGGGGQHARDENRASGDVGIGRVMHVGQTTEHVKECVIPV